MTTGIATARAGASAPAAVADTGRVLRVASLTDSGRLHGLIATLAAVAAAPDLSAALRALLRGAVDLLDGTDGVVAIHDPEAGGRRQVNLHPDGTFEERDRPPPVPGSFQWRLMQGEDPILIEDFTKLDPATYPLYDQMLAQGRGSAVNVPVDLPADPGVPGAVATGAGAGNRPPRRLGTLCINSSQARRFTDEDRALAAVLASQTAAAVDRARAHERERRAERALRENEARFRATLEQRVAERTAQLEAANRELEAFTYSVSHDLRAPLRAIDGFSRILTESHAGELGPQAHRYLQLVRDNARQMGELVDDLLAFSRLGRQTLAQQQVEPAELVRQSWAALEEERRGRHVELTLGDLPPCDGDPHLLRQVFVNLLTNALKFTRRKDVARVEVGSTAADGETVYFVRDNGVGFDMRYAHKLFGVFQRLHRAEDYEGTGVGLAIVQRIVQRHGGRVWAEGALDAGATFFFTLGAPEEEDEPRPAASTEARRQRAGADD